MRMKNTLLSCQEKNTANSKLLWKRRQILKAVRLNDVWREKFGFKLPIL